MHAVADLTVSESKFSNGKIKLGAYLSHSWGIAPTSSCGSPPTSTRAYMYQWDTQVVVAKQQCMFLLISSKHVQELLEQEDREK